MILYVVRHALAEEAAAGGDDARHLTDVGRKRTQKAAAGIRALAIELDVILTSPVARAAETAAIIAEAAVKAGVPVTLSLDGGEPVDAGSALMIMTLGAGNGAQVTVASQDDEAMRTIAELVQQDLDA